MKNYIYLFFLFAFFAFQEKETKQGLPVGSICYSMLSPEQFKTRNPTWVYMDGETNVEGSEYHSLTGNTTIPDARNMFLRGMGGKYDYADKATGTKRTVGSKQSFSTAKPRRPLFGGTGELDLQGMSDSEELSVDFSKPIKHANTIDNNRISDGKHKHTYRDGLMYENINWVKKNLIINSGYEDLIILKQNGYMHGYKGNDWDNSLWGRKSLTEDHEGQHSHRVIIAGGGDQETRPNNIALYVYIKINK